MKLIQNVEYALVKWLNLSISGPVKGKGEEFAYEYDFLIQFFNHNCHKKKKKKQCRKNIHNITKQTNKQTNKQWHKDINNIRHIGPKLHQCCQCCVFNRFQ